MSEEDDIFALIRQDAEDPIKVRDKDLGSISNLAQQQVKLQATVSKLENELELAKKELLEVSDKKLPEAMINIGLDEFKMSDGSKVAIKSFYVGRIAEEKREEAFEWLTDHGEDAIVKTKVVVEFGMKEIEIARAFMEFIRGFNQCPVEPYLDQDIHWATLRKWLGEMMENPEISGNFPLDLFGAYLVNRATIKSPR